MGSTTYEWVVNHQTQTGEPWTYDMPSYVFTHRTLPVMDGAEVELAGVLDHDDPGVERELIGHRTDQRRLAGAGLP